MARTQPRATSAPPRPAAPVWRRLAIAAFAISGSVALAFNTGYWLLARDLPSVRPLVAGVESGRFDRPPGILPNPPVPVEQIPDVMVMAAVAIEDRRFFQHGGIDWQGIARAVLTNVTTRDLREGGSSITQQLAKNLYLSPERTWQRKLRELILAREIEAALTKPEIVSYYLNRIYFGSNAYGIGAAAAVYFNKSADDLTLSEAALLAGVLPAPSVYSPHVNPTIARRRRNLVLDAMAEGGFIPATEAARAKALPVRVVPLSP